MNSYTPSILNFNVSRTIDLFTGKSISKAIDLLIGRSALETVRSSMGIGCISEAMKSLTVATSVLESYKLGLRINDCTGNISRPKIFTLLPVSSSTVDEADCPTNTRDDCIGELMDMLYKSGNDKLISILFELEWDELKSIYPKLKASNETLIEFLLDIDKKAKQSISRLGKREKEILIYAFNKTNNKDYWIKWDELKPSCDNLSSPRSKSASLSRSTKILETRELLIRDGQKRTTAIRLTALGRRAAKQFTNQTVNKTPRSRPNC